MEAFKQNRIVRRKLNALYSLVIDKYDPECAYRVIVTSVKNSVDRKHYSAHCVV